MKRIFVCIMIALLLAGCSSSPPSAAGTVKLVTLTADQEKTITLLPDQHELLLFDYDSKQEYTHFDTWVEIYQKGVLVEPKIASFDMMTDEPRRFQGQLAVNISQIPDFRWQFSAVKEGGIASGAIATSKHYSSDAAQAFGPLIESAVIEDGKEILLYARTFSPTATTKLNIKQSDLEDPEQLKNYTYVHLVKCKFY